MSAIISDDLIADYVKCSGDGEALLFAKAKLIERGDGTTVPVNHYVALMTSEGGDRYVVEHWTWQDCGYWVRSFRTDESSDIELLASISNKKVGEDCYGMPMQLTPDECQLLMR